MNKPIALVTGANGFVGSHLCEELLAHGYRVRALVRKTSNLQFIEHLDLELVYGDVSQPQSLVSAVSDADLVFHPAGLVRAPDLKTFLEVNQIGTINLLETVRNSNPGLKRFVHISSQAAAGPSHSLSPVDETAKTRPVSYYGQSKLASEEEVLRFGNDLPVTIIRPPAVYGPRDSDVFKFFKLVKLGINPRIGCEKQYVSMVHVSDLVRCIRIASASDKAVGEVFFACNREYYEIREMIGVISRVMNSPVVDISLPGSLAGLIAFTIEKIFKIINKTPPLSRDKLKELSQSFWICSPQKAERILGWKAEIGIKDGLRRTYNWYREKGWIK